MKKLLFTTVITLGAAFLMQGFQCGATKEMVQAKQKIKQEKYQEAEDLLGLELNNNPDNETARLMLIDVNRQQGDMKETARLIMDASNQLKNPKNLDELAKMKNQLWVASYNGGIKHYQKYSSTRDKNQLDSAIEKFETGSIVRPNFLDFYYLKGVCYAELQDTSNAMKAYDEYVQQIEPELNFAQSNGFGYEMAISSVLGKVGGTVLNTIQDTLKSGNGRVNRVDQIMLADSTEVYLYSANKESAETLLYGWRLDYPEDWSDREKNTWVQINLDPLTILAQNYYFKNDLENALIYLKKLQQADPFNDVANSSIIEIYQKLDKMDVAIAELSKLTQDNPEEPLYFVLWADMLTNNKQYDEAITKYEEALKVDPKYAFALRNIASTYKNKAAKVQNEENEKNEKDNTYQINTDAYFPFLEKSVEYFERARETDKFKNDPVILGELANNYQALNKNDKLMEVLQQMEDIENLIPENTMEKFYLDLIRVYSNIKPQTPEIGKKSQKIQQKLQQYYERKVGQ